MKLKRDEYNYLTFILRGQPFHYGHAKVITTALEHAQHVIVLIGSSNRARDWFNPFSFEERAKIITEWYAEEVSTSDGRLTILPLNDHLYDLDGWLKEVQTKVTTTVNTRERGWTDYPPKIGLIGHSKDHTSFYLNLFPQWGNINVEAFTDKRLFNSTDIRNAYYSPVDDNFAWQELLEGIPPATMRFLESHHGSAEFQHMIAEHEYIRTYKEDHKFRNPEIPYNPNNTAVDGCITQSGHILLIERKDHPGAGLWAMPGGFLNDNETILDAMLRECWEETKLKVAPKVICGSITGMNQFDDPHRSARGRILSNTFRVELDPSNEGLPKVKGRSDAKRAFWQPLSELPPKKFFEDHYFIIQNMVGGNKRHNAY
jgi:bifunctional NMN adenylyltransferase/nudix hydrolase